jgi:hypothetical protein
MLLVKIYFLNGETDLKYCWDLSEICLDGVKELKVLSNEKAA